jgi:LysM repeat protein
LTSDKIYAGQNLIVGYQHTVAAGDTLFLIARKYNVTISQLKTWNQRTSNTIYIGEKLRIYS